MTKAKKLIEVALPIKEISAEEIQKILDFEENWALDKKGKDISPAKLSRTVAALANHNGGDIYL